MDSHSGDAAITRLDIAILPFDEASARYLEFEAVISVENPGFGKRLRFKRGPGMPEQCVVAFDDVDHDHASEGVVLADVLHVDRVLTFAQRHSGSRLMVHCQAGKCRSPAVALAILADRLGPGHEAEAVEVLMRLRPQAYPNLIFLSVADRVLERDGALVSAWAAREASDPEIVMKRARKTEIHREARARGRIRGVHHGPSS